MRLRATLSGLRAAYSRLRCHHPAMRRASVTTVGTTHVRPGWECPDCGLVLADLDSVSFS